MTSERVGFDPSSISNSAVLIVNLIMLFAAIAYWNVVQFSLRLFVVGFVGSIFDTLGKVSSLNALRYGPGGPSTALVALSGPYLVIVVALQAQKMIKPTEILALILCLLGAFTIVIPQIMLRVFCPCLAKKSSGAPGISQHQDMKLNKHKQYAEIPDEYEDPYRNNIDEQNK